MPLGLNQLADTTVLLEKTNHLRILVRVDKSTGKTERVLQQLALQTTSLASGVENHEELWKDVPVVEEEQAT